MTSFLLRSRVRRGTILIIVAGISALLASLAIAFLVRIRQGSESTAAVALETQARLMLHAACAYILESSRLGYGPSKTQALSGAVDGQGFVTTRDGAFAVREAFGWIDVRESEGNGFANPGQPGPRDQRGDVVYQAGKWPDVGGVVLCPMRRWTQPPYAIRPTVAYNPILIDKTRNSDPRWGRPLLLNPDPQPVTDNGWPSAVSSARWTEFVKGDPTPVSESTGMSWFRVYRKSAATFVITCGAGGTLGFKDWNEVQNWSNLPGAAGGGPLQFNNDKTFFDSLRASEVRLWYEVRWSGAVRPLDFRYEEAPWWMRWLQVAFAYRVYPVNGTQYTGWSRTNRFNPNPLGTISYIQRLDALDGNPLDAKTGQPFAAW